MDTKITDLTSYTDPIDADVVPIVDTGGNETKKITIAELRKSMVGAEVACASKLASTQSIPNNDVDTTITLENEEIDPNNRFASSTFTAVKPGYYQVSGSIFWQAVENGINYGIDIKKNGSPVAGAVIIAGAGSLNLTTAISKLVFLDVGDTLVLTGAHNSSGAILVKNDTDGTFLSVAKVADEV